MSTIASELATASEMRTSSSTRFSALTGFVSGCRRAIERVARAIRPTQAAAVTVWIPAPPREVEVVG
ncbi:MAG TPA: hypothetical protein VFY65_02425 [Longimicrobium sp.]|nr:hypothetical protein [Longimicrobium sp.]